MSPLREALMDEARRGGGQGERLKKAYKKSHLFCKSSSSSSSSSSPLSATTASVVQQQHPVITYSRASRFIELVQKLTGLPPRSAARHREQSTGIGNSHRDGSDSTVLQNCFTSGNELDAAA
ncbi:hypothetical protein B296_00038487 [Ensete ventricosum]|uniref:VQ domain-containing protein n=1 Tax=Ensete ventricosum TaxID=4639 RepID=A0A426Z6E0_ENSVE|nr:hypothetical protein B296_00038487 [Ensete ventricosum]